MTTIFNPKNISWTHEGLAENGEVIESPLDFELGIWYAEREAEDITPLMSVVGSLVSEGEYKAPLSLAEVPQDELITIYLRAIRRDGPEPVYSDWSNGVDVIYKDIRPTTPVNFSAA